MNRRIEIVARHRDGWELPVELAVSPAKIGDAYIFSAFIRDITDRRRAERRLASQYAVTRVLSEATTLEEAVPKIIQAIGESLEWDLGVFWRVDKATGVLRCLDQWKAPSVQADAFILATWQHVFTRGQGFAGTYLGQRQVGLGDGCRAGCQFPSWSGRLDKLGSTGRLDFRF